MKKVLIAAGIVAALGFAMIASAAFAAGDGTYTPVTLCHAHPTGAGGSGPADGYVLITVDQSGAFDGHLGHPNDIIPAGSFTDKKGVVHSWDAQGDQSILAAGCVVPPPTCEETGDCPPPPPVDVCPNLEGDQATVPAGYEVNDQGDCVLIPEPPPCDTPDCGPVVPPVVTPPPNVPPVPPSPTLKQYKQDVQNGAEPGGG
jgi:hypothetical protein